MAPTAVRSARIRLAGVGPGRSRLGGTDASGSSYRRAESACSARRFGKTRADAGLVQTVRTPPRRLDRKKPRRCWLGPDGPIGPNDSEDPCEGWVLPPRECEGRDPLPPREEDALYAIRSKSIGPCGPFGPSQHFRGFRLPLRLDQRLDRLDQIGPAGSASPCETEPDVAPGLDAPASRRSLVAPIVVVDIHGLEEGGSVIVQAVQPVFSRPVALRVRLPRPADPKRSARA